MADAQKNPEHVDFDQARELVAHVYGFLQGAMVSGLIHLGDRLGLYQALRGAGPVTPSALAAATGLHERWLLEWLRGQAAAGLVDYKGDNRFELTDTQAMVLADEESSLVFAAGAFSGLPQRMAVLNDLPESFRTGAGFTFDAAGPDGCQATERMFAPWYRHMLVPVVLRSMDGLTDKLEAGAKVADVGCGAGVAIVEMAKAYPASRFHGYDISRHAVDRARTNVREAGVDNVELHDAAVDPLPGDASFELVTAFDCIHDMTRPQQMLETIRRALRPDGTLLIADIKSRGSFDEDLGVNPMLAMMYGLSVTSCLPSGLSEADGAGLGTLGFTPDVAREMTRRAGFTRFERHDLGHPVNAYYEVRP